MALPFPTGQTSLPLAETIQSVVSMVTDGQTILREKERKRGREKDGW